MTTKENNSIEQWPEKDNALAGIELTKEIAARHEKELRELIEQNDGANILEPIKNGPITAEQLVSEFEELAHKKNINLDDFYARAARFSFHGHRFEMTTFMQILFHHFAKGSESNK